MTRFILLALAVAGALGAATTFVFQVITVACALNACGLLWR